MFHAFPKGGGVYVIVCKATGHFYIGSTNSFKSRLNGHRTTLRGGYHCNNMMQVVFDIYGEETFDVYVLEKMIEPGEVELIEREIEWMKLFKAPEHHLCMNKRMASHEQHFIDVNGKTYIQRGRELEELRTS